MNVALWLTRRELAARRGRASLAVLVVAAAAALVTTTELLARGRQEAVAAQVDGLGAPLRMLPHGVSSEAIARYDLGGWRLPPDAEARARAALGRELRALDVRRVVSANVDGAVTPVIAASSGGARVAAGEVALGSVAAERLGAGRGSIAVGGNALRVSAILPTTATIDDTAIYVSSETMDALAAGGPSELRIFLSPGANARTASERLSAAFTDAQVLRMDRGEVADSEMDGALARNRIALYLVAAAVAALCLAIAAHLDAAERRVELATLVAVGATRSALARMLLARSALIAVAGGVGGVALGFILSSGLDANPAGPLVRTFAISISVLSGAIGVAVLAATPTVFASATRNPVTELQDG